MFQVITCNLHNGSVKQVLMFLPFYRWGNWVFQGDQWIYKGDTKSKCWGSNYLEFFLLQFLVFNNNIRIPFSRYFLVHSYYKEHCTDWKIVILHRVSIQICLRGAENQWKVIWKFPLKRLLNFRWYQR